MQIKLTGNGLTITYTSETFRQLQRDHDMCSDRDVPREILARWRGGYWLHTTITTTKWNKNCLRQFPQKKLTDEQWSQLWVQIKRNRQLQRWQCYHEIYSLVVQGHCSHVIQTELVYLECNTHRIVLSETDCKFKSHQSFVQTFFASWRQCKSGLAMCSKKP